MNKIYKKNLELLNGLRSMKYPIDITDNNIAYLDGKKELVNKILEVIKKEKGLTYTDAYVALSAAYYELKNESNFVQVQK